MRITTLYSFMSALYRSTNGILVSPKTYEAIAGAGIDITDDARELYRGSEVIIDNDIVDGCVGVMNKADLIRYKRLRIKE